MVRAEKDASETTGDEWQADTLIWLDWAGMSGSKKEVNAGLRIRLLGFAAVDRDLLLLIDQTEPFRQSWQASTLYRRHLSQELPCVGDWVCVEKGPTDDFGLVHMLLERRTALRRKSAGDSVEVQMIAANVDTVIIVQSCHYDFNLKRLERYLVMVRDGGADPCVLLTKTDLVEPEVLASQLAEIRAAGVYGAGADLEQRHARGN